MDTGLILPKATIDLSGRPEFERWCKKSSVPGLQVLEKYWMRLDPDDSSITSCLVRDGYWEAWISLAIARAVTRGWSCVDAGANVGWYTLLMLAAGAGRVLAVEPSPKYSKFLRDTVAANNLGGVVSLSNLALGAMPGKVEMHEYGKYGGSTSAFKDMNYEITGTFIATVAPLDLILSDWKQIDFIKMDIEGGEREAWRGMEDIRSRCGPTIFLETHKDHGYDVPEFIDEIRRDGYFVRAVGEDGEIVDYDPRKWELWLTKA